MRALTPYRCGCPRHDYRTIPDFLCPQCNEQHKLDVKRNAPVDFRIPVLHGRDIVYRIPKHLIDQKNQRKRRK